MLHLSFIILEMVKEDTENEVKASSGNNSLKFRGILQESFYAQTASKVADKQELAEFQEDIADTKEVEDSKASDLAEHQVPNASLEKDCAWVESHFNPRREKRKRD